jgi:hypothetical protein
MKKILIFLVTVSSLHSGSLLQEIAKTTKFLDKNSPSPLKQFMQDQAQKSVVAASSEAICSYGLARMGLATQASTIPQAIPYLFLQATTFAGLDTLVESIKQRSVQWKGFLLNTSKEIMARILFLGINRHHGTIESNTDLIRFQRNHPDLNLAIDAINGDAPSIILAGISSRILPS